MCDMTATRRHFLASTAALLAGSRFASGKTLKVIGVQLYTLRNVINDKPLEILQALQKIGYTEVEVIRGNIDKIWPALKQTSLKPVSLHVDTAYFTKEQDKLQATFEDAKQKGFQYMVCPYIAPADRGGPEVMKKLADTLNKAGERAKKLGMNLAYHNHAFEFAPSGEGTLLDILMKETDPKLVALELDVATLLAFAELEAETVIAEVATMVFDDTTILTVKLVLEAGQLVLGSSANLTGSGQKFTLEDVEDEVKEVADIIVDYGLQRAHVYNVGTMNVDFGNDQVKVIRFGNTKIADKLVIF